MEVRKSRVRWTYSEFARLPPSGSTRYEVIDDELVVTPAPTTQHQRVVTRLLVQLATFAEEHDLGEVFPAPLDVLFAEGDYFEPDLLFVSKKRVDLLSDRGVEGPPDLVVEITSPSTTDRDRGVKLERYDLYGVAEYWIVDPDARTIEVWDLAEGAEEPVVHGPDDVLRWSPGDGRATLEIDVGEVIPPER